MCVWSTEWGSMADPALFPQPASPPLPSPLPRPHPARKIGHLYVAVYPVVAFAAVRFEGRTATKCFPLLQGGGVTGCQLSIANKTHSTRYD